MSEEKKEQVPQEELDEINGGLDPSVIKEIQEKMLVPCPRCGSKNSPNMWGWCHCDNCRITYTNTGNIINGD